MKILEKLLIIFYITFFANMIVAFILNDDFSYSVIKGLIVSSFGSAITGVLNFIMRIGVDIDE